MLRHANERVVDRILRERLAQRGNTLPTKYTYSSGCGHQSGARDAMMLAARVYKSTRASASARTVEVLDDDLRDTTDPILRLGVRTFDRAPEERDDDWT